MEYKIVRLHQNKDLFRNAVLAASQRFGIPEIFIEKDYWVTLVLNKIFHSDMADQIVFKGGTCLSKCHQIIQRFSEDIDLVIFRNEDENDNQLKKKIRQISKIVEQILPEIPVEGLTKKREISGKRFINTTSVLTVTLGRQENN